MNDNCKEQIKQLEDTLRNYEVDIYNLKCIIDEMNREFRNIITDMRLRIQHLENVCDLDDGK